jgi:lipopolysaccharide kinase (Kdo/WaaP) family protein
VSTWRVEKLNRGNVDLERGLAIRCLDSVTEADVRSALAEHYEAITTRSDRLVQPKHWQPVTRVRCGSGTVAVKEYYHGFARSLLGLAGAPSLARTGMNVYQALAERGIRTARVVAIAEQQGVSTSRRSYLLTRWVEEATRVKDAVASLAAASGDNGMSPGWEMLARALAAHLAGLHRREVFIPDYRGRNLLLLGWDAGAEVILLDFDGARLGPVRWPGRLDNLYQLRRQLGKRLTDAQLECLTRAYLVETGAGADGLEKRAACLVGFLRPYRPAGRPALCCAEFIRRHRALFPEACSPALQSRVPG